MSSTESFNIKVNCYAGYRGEEEPREFLLGKIKIQIKEIIDRWLSPDHRYFKVRGSDGDTYIVRHNVSTDQWELTMFKQEHK